jgi:hypothetical protein
MTIAEKIADLTSYGGQRIDCEILFTHVCENNQWRYDLEESDCMLYFCRTWADKGYKAMVMLEEYICSPPHDESGTIEEIFIAKINPADLGKNPASYTLDDYDDGDPAYWHLKYGDRDWRVQYTQIDWADAPEDLVAEIYADLVESGALQAALLD